jgi:hypothetical protein
VYKKACPNCKGLGDLIITDTRRQYLCFLCGYSWMIELKNRETDVVKDIGRFSLLIVSQPYGLVNIKIAKPYMHLNKGDILNITLDYYDVDDFFNKMIPYLDHFEYAYLFYYKNNKHFKVNLLEYFSNDIKTG